MTAVCEWQTTAFINELKILSPAHWLNVYHSFSITASAPPKVEVHCMLYILSRLLQSLHYSHPLCSPITQSIFLTPLSLYFFQFYTQQLVKSRYSKYENNPSRQEKTRSTRINGTRFHLRIPGTGFGVSLHDPRLCLNKPKQQLQGIRITQVDKVKR